MKKQNILFMAISGMAALIGIGAEVGVYADLNTTLTDTISVTIEDNCSLEYDETEHVNGANKGTWDENTLSVTMGNASVDTNIGKTNFKVVCNDNGGFNVNLDTTPLKSDGDAIPFKNSEPTSSASSWGIWNGTKWVTDGGVVATGNSATANTTFSVTYGVGISSTQSAGTYEADAVYTLTHPAVAESEYYTLTFELDENSVDYAVLSTTSYKIPKNADGTRIEFDESNNILLEDGTVLVEAIIKPNATAKNYAARNWTINGSTYSGWETRFNDPDFYIVTEDTTLTLTVDYACILAGSKIAMADGTEKNVEDLQVGDEVLAYDNHSGTITSSRVNTIWSGISTVDVFTVRLENGNSIKIATQENVFDTNNKEWLLINLDSYQSAVGTNIMINNNGEIGTSRIVAIDHEYKKVEHYTLYTDVTLDYIANNIVMMFPFYFSNTRYTIGDDYKIDMDIYNVDVAQYGLYTYADFEDVCTEKTFDSLGLKDMKHVVEKGYITLEEFKEGVKEFQKDIDYYNAS